MLKESSVRIGARMMLEVALQEKIAVAIHEWVVYKVKKSVARHS